MGNQPGSGHTEPVPTAEDDQLDLSKDNTLESLSGGEEREYALVSSTEGKGSTLLNTDEDVDNSSKGAQQQQQQDKKQEDPPTIHRAADKGHGAMVQFLIDNKARVDALNGEGWTPLHCAVYNNHRDVVRVLIKNKAYVDFPFPTNFSTALHWAAGFSDLQMVQLLVNCKAEVNARDANSERPIDYAKRSGSQPIIDYLSSNPQPVTPKSTPTSPTRPMSPMSPITLPSATNSPISLTKRLPSPTDPTSSKSVPNSPVKPTSPVSAKRTTTSPTKPPSVNSPKFSASPSPTFP